MKYFSSDWHISHKSILKYSNRPFSSIEEMNNTIISNMFSPLKKGDIFYFLGDMSWSKQGYEMVFDNIPKGVQFIWVLGNHDEKDWKQYRSRVTSIQPKIETKIQGNHVTLCHYPMLTWNRSHYNSWMLFGHHHNGGDKSGSAIDKYTKGKMLNVNCEFHNFKPLSENDIVEYMNSVGDNLFYIGG